MSAQDQDIRRSIQHRVRELLLQGEGSVWLQNNPAAIAALSIVWICSSETGSDVNWRTLFLLCMFSSTESAVLLVLVQEFIDVIAKNANAIVKSLIFIVLCRL